MDKRKIQKQRMKKYFVNAAKEIIKKEGLKELTARKVGEKAGYSYATIYNYFDDLNTLIAYCAFDFLEDCYEFIIRHKDNSQDSIQQIITDGLAYFKYFANKPNIFQVVFLEDLERIPKELIEYNKKPSIALLLKDNLVECAKEGHIEESNIELLGNLITSSIHGKLLFYIKNRNIETINEVIVSIENEIKFLIKERKNI